MSDYELGEHVTVSKILRKIKDSRSVHWASVKRDPVDGIVVGRRKVSAGTIESEDGYRWFAPDTDACTPYWLVAVSLGRNPLRVPDDGIEAMKVVEPDDGCDTIPIEWDEATA